jgi:hypothetical protein
VVATGGALSDKNLALIILDQGRDDMQGWTRVDACSLVRAVA